jgi:tRNA dimethylallyltransferase
LRLFLKEAKKPLIVILGPTASGKTALSLDLAKKFRGEIISTDSRQIYKEMDIGTDAILPAQQEGIQHHLMGIAKPDKTITTAEYTELALSKIKEIYGRKNIPILVGGTGLYISSIIFSYQIPRVPPDEKLRAKLYKEAEKKGNEYVHAKLAKLDPEAAKKIHPNNLRYVVRALEINLATGKNKVDVQKKSPFDVFIIGINWPREKLYERVNLRVDLQLKRGLLDEVKALLAKGYKENSPAMSSLGVKEIIPYLKGKATLDECVEVLKKNTRNYAKRQMTWFRRYDTVPGLNIVKINYE